MPPSAEKRAPAAEESAARRDHPDHGDHDHDHGRERGALASARRTVALEIEGLRALAASLDEFFVQAVERLSAIAGRVIVSGIGKSGHVARKVAATLASTGTPAQFVHPAEASHGDLGMITDQDALLVFSRSGESAELGDLAAYSRRFRILLIAVCANRSSALAGLADIVLPLPAAEEACPIGLAPTTSTTMQLALGDALALALLERSGFTAARFRDFHPGGRLGAGLKSLRDLMHTPPALPLCAENLPMSEALLIMSQKGFGCIGVVDGSGRLAGVITDGDLRRHMDAGLLRRPARAVMTPGGQSAPPDMLAAAALEKMNRARITTLFVVEARKPVGLVHIHDFLRAGLA